MRDSWPLLAFLLLAFPAQAFESEAVRLSTRDGVKQAFILIHPDGPPVASVILFAGGEGDIGIGGEGRNYTLYKKGNFLVRSRDRFAAQGLLVAVPDAPTDNSSGMGMKFRMSGEHGQDTAAIAAHLKAVTAAPVWAVGTSMGSFSAANAAVRLSGQGIDGLVLTSTMTKPSMNWPISGTYPEGVISMGLDRVTVPSLVVAHKDDACEFTPASDAPRLAAALKASPRVEVKLVEGGLPPKSVPCEAYAAHGFLGIEDGVVTAIAAFIKANSPTR